MIKLIKALFITLGLYFKFCFCTMQDDKSYKFCGYSLHFDLKSAAYIRFYVKPKSGKSSYGQWDTHWSMFALIDALYKAVKGTER